MPLFIVLIQALHTKTKILAIDIKETLHSMSLHQPLCEETRKLILQDTTMNKSQQN